MKKVTFKNLKISSTVTINPKYWDIKVEQQKRWKEQDDAKK